MLLFFAKTAGSQDIQKETNNKYVKPGIQNQSKPKRNFFNFNILGPGAFLNTDLPETDTLGQYDLRQQYEAQIMLPVLAKDKLAILIGYKYLKANYNFSETGNLHSSFFQTLNSKSLNNNTFNLNILKPLDNKQFLGFSLKYGLGGNYSQWISFKSQYAIYSLHAIYSRKPNEDFQWGAGIFLSKDFARSQIIPLFIYNRNFTPKLGVEFVFPLKLFLRYNLNPNNLILFGSEYKTLAYHIAPDQDAMHPETGMVTRELIPQIKLEHHFFKGIWGQINAGYQINLRHDFVVLDNSIEDWSAIPGNNWYFNVGLFFAQ